MPRNVRNCSLMLNLICSMLCKYGWLCISYKLITKTSSCMQRTAGSTRNAACSHLRLQGAILLRGSPTAALPPSSSGGHPRDHSFSDRQASVRADIPPIIVHTRVSPSILVIPGKRPRAPSSVTSTLGRFGDKTCTWCGRWGCTYLLTKG